MALDSERQELWVTLSRNNTLGVIDLKTNQLSQVPVGMAPYSVALGPANKAYVTNWAGRKPKAGEVTAKSSGSDVLVDPKTGVASSGTVSVVDTRARAELQQIEVGLHPSGMAFNSDRSRLFVTNANSDTVSVIDTSSDRVVEVISVVAERSRPFGSAPNALAVSPDNSTLYVANGTDNAICVVALGRLVGLAERAPNGESRRRIHSHRLVPWSGAARQTARFSHRRQHEGHRKPQSTERPEGLQFSRPHGLDFFH